MLNISESLALALFLQGKTMNLMKKIKQFLSGEKSANDEKKVIVLNLPLGTFSLRYYGPGVSRDRGSSI